MIDLYPAIDLRDGRCVRLHQGDYDRETVYGDDPVRQAHAFASAGAEWIHVVDLDAARTGELVNAAIVAEIAAAVPARVQVGGGIRSADAAEQMLDAGVDRVVIGTAAVTDPDLVPALAKTYPIAVGLDARAGMLAVEGWERPSDQPLLEAARRFSAAGAAALVVTDIARDGTLDGPDLAGLADVIAVATVPVIASGGVGSLADLRRLHDVGPAGVIVGRALYEGKFTLEEGLEQCAAHA